MLELWKVVFLLKLFIFLIYLFLEHLLDKCCVLLLDNVLLHIDSVHVLGNAPYESSVLFETNKMHINIPDFHCAGLMASSLRNLVQRKLVDQ